MRRHTGNLVHRVIERVRTSTSVTPTAVDHDRGVPTRSTPRPDTTTFQNTPIAKNNKSQSWNTKRALLVVLRVAHSHGNLCLLHVRAAAAANAATTAAAAERVPNARVHRHLLMLALRALQRDRMHRHGMRACQAPATSTKLDAKQTDTHARAECAAHPRAHTQR